MITRSRLSAFLFRSLVPAVIGLIGMAHAQAQVPGNLTFQPAAEKSFSFDTGQLRGQLRAPESAFGLFNLEQGTAGTKLAGRYGLMNVYRVFSDGKRYGDAGWGWPSHAERMDDGAVVVACAADASRPFQLRGIYRWRDPTTLDLEIQVLPQRELHDFEVFLASYFDPSFGSCQVNVKSPSDASHRSTFVSAKETLGDWLMFPRDATAVKLIQDGRWELLPNPVQWKILPQLERPLAVRREVGGETTALLMARAADCFAVAMPYETEGHFSVYLSLFGRDLPAGKIAIARARLQILQSPSDAEMVESFRTFEKQAADSEN